eukprot:31416-Pelagococcus_subviridis.AAC.7
MTCASASGSDTTACKTYALLSVVPVDSRVVQRLAAGDDEVARSGEEDVSLKLALHRHRPRAVVHHRDVLRDHLPSRALELERRRGVLIVRVELDLDDANVVRGHEHDFSRVPPRTFRREVDRHVVLARDLANDHIAFVVLLHDGLCLGAVQRQRDPVLRNFHVLAVRLQTVLNLFRPRRRAPKLIDLVLELIQRVLLQERPLRVLERPVLVRERHQNLLRRDLHGLLFGHERHRVIRRPVELVHERSVLCIRERDVRDRDGVASANARRSAVHPERIREQARVHFRDLRAVCRGESRRRRGRDAAFSRPPRARARARGRRRLQRRRVRGRFHLVRVEVLHLDRELAVARERVLELHGRDHMLVAAGVKVESPQRRLGVELRFETKHERRRRRRGPLAIAREHQLRLARGGRPRRERHGQVRGRLRAQPHFVRVHFEIRLALQSHLVHDVLLRRVRELDLFRRLHVQRARELDVRLRYQLRERVIQEQHEQHALRGFGVDELRRGDQVRHVHRLEHPENALRVREVIAVGLRVAAHPAAVLFQRRPVRHERGVKHGAGFQEDALRDGEDLRAAQGSVRGLLHGGVHPGHRLELLRGDAREHENLDDLRQRRAVRRRGGGDEPGAVSVQRDPVLQRRALGLVRVFVRVRVVLRDAAIENAMEVHRVQEHLRFHGV